MLGGAGCFDPVGPTNFFDGDNVESGKFWMIFQKRWRPSEFGTSKNAPLPQMAMHVGEMLISWQFIVTSWWQVKEWKWHPSAPTLCYMNEANIPSRCSCSLLLGCNCNVGASECYYIHPTCYTLRTQIPYGHPETGSISQSPRKTHGQTHYLLIRIKKNHGTTPLKERWLEWERYEILHRARAIGTFHFTVLFNFWKLKHVCPVCFNFPYFNDSAIASFLGTTMCESHASLFYPVIQIEPHIRMSYDWLGVSPKLPKHLDDTNTATGPTKNLQQHWLHLGTWNPKSRQSMTYFTLQISFKKKNSWQKISWSPLEKKSGGTPHSIGGHWPKLKWQHGFIAWESDTEISSGWFPWEKTPEVSSLRNGMVLSFDRIFLWLMNWTLRS